MIYQTYKVWFGTEDGIPDEEGSLYPKPKRVFRVKFAFHLDDVQEIEEYTHKTWEFSGPRLFVTINERSHILEETFEGFQAVWSKHFNQSSMFKFN